MDENKKFPKDLLNFFMENLKHRKMERKKRLEVRKEFTLEEEISNSIIHSIGLLLAIAGLVLLILKAEGAMADVGVILFASTAIIMYAMSTIYHAFPNGRTKNVFERLDHASIYLFIAGTYTPFCFILFEGALGWVLFGLQWGLAVIGIVLKSIWVDRFVILHLIIFLLMGWAIIFFIIPFLGKLQLGGLIFLLTGGISYSIGTIFFVFRLFKFHHTIWHFFVVVGTILHFFCLYFYVL